MVQLDQSAFPTRTDWVAADVHRRLVAGEWNIGERLPTEFVLVEQYGVSRATIRSAIQVLESKGLVNTRRGSGSYALSQLPVVSADLRALDSMSSTIGAHGMTPTIEFHKIEQRLADSEELVRLDLNERDQVLSTARAIRAADEVVAYSFEVIPRKFLGDSFSVTSMVDSMFELLDRNGVPVVSSLTQVHSRRADERFAAHVDDDALFLCLDQLHRDNSGLPVALSSTFFVEGRFNFMLTRTRTPEHG